jgi:iron complex transport system permease protein
MVVLSVLLVRWLFVGQASSLHLMLLVGMVAGILFRSLTSFAMRMIDPNESPRCRTACSRISTPSDAVAVACGSCCCWAVASSGAAAMCWTCWRWGGMPPSTWGWTIAAVLQLLLVVCTMVAVSTALVGPVTFFGLLVANMAYQWMGTRRHAWVLPAVLLWGTVLLLGGQVVLERVLGFNSALSVVVEFGAAWCLLRC